MMQQHHRNQLDALIEQMIEDLMPETGDPMEEAEIAHEKAIEQIMEVINL